MTKAHNIPLIIIGGGLTGKMMALSLAHCGYEIGIIAPQSPPQTKDRRSTTIHHAGWKMLTALGLTQNLLAVASPIHHINVAIGAARPFHSDWLLRWSSIDQIPMAHVVENYLFDAVLDQAIAEADTITCHRYLVTGYKEMAHACVIETDNGGTFHAQLAIACDGANSNVRDLAGLSASVEETNQSAIIADVALQSPHHDTACQRFLETGPIALMPLQGNAASLVWSTTKAQAQHLLSLDDQAFSAALSEAFGDEFGTLTLSGQTRSFALRPQYNRRLGKGRLLLAGDAAHAIHPLAGMGYNLALADAAILADEINTLSETGLSLDHPSLLRRYHKRRLPEISAMIALTSQLNKVLSRPKNIITQTMAIGMSILDKTPLKAALRNAAMGGKLAKAPLLDGRVK